ncbi:MAG: hypothetical protein R3B49_09680 [Phycisphaerales bacterium]
MPSGDAPTCWSCGYSRAGLDPDQPCPECDTQADNRPDEPLSLVVTPIALSLGVVGLVLSVATLMIPGLIVIIVASCLGWRVRHPSTAFRVTRRRRRQALLAECSIWSWLVLFVIMLITGTVWPGIWNWW